MGMDRDICLLRNRSRGDVVIRSGSMEMKNSKIEASTYGAGNSGNLEVHTGSLDMSGEARSIRATTILQAMPET